MSCSIIMEQLNTDPVKNKEKKHSRQVMQFKVVKCTSAGARKLVEDFFNQKKEKSWHFEETAAAIMSSREDKCHNGWDRLYLYGCSWNTWFTPVCFYFIFFLPVLLKFGSTSLRFFRNRKSLRGSSLIESLSSVRQAFIGELRFTINNPRTGAQYSSAHFKPTGGWHCTV